MDLETFNALCRTTREALDENRLADALAGVISMTEMSGDWDLKSAASEVDEAYRMMLRYFRLGMKDDSRIMMYRTFLNRCYEVVDRTERSCHAANTSSLYAATLRTVQVLRVSFSGLCERLAETCRQLAEAENARPVHESRLKELKKKHEELYRQMFDFVWTSSLWNTSDVEIARRLLRSDDMKETDLALFVSALTLATLHYFDTNKYSLLLDLLSDRRPLLRSRAWVGFAIVTLRHDRRIQLQPGLPERLAMWSDDAGVKSELRNLQIQLLTTLETREIEKQLHEDIIPSMLKNAPFRHSKLELDSIEEMLRSNDPNPEWRENETVKRIEDKLKRLAEMQAQGADVYMGTFSAMKQQYPFFNVLANWFLVFDEHYPGFDDTLRGMPPFLRSLFASDMLCDSDKYSFAFMLSSIPAAQRRLMQEQFERMGATDVPAMGEDEAVSNSDERLRRMYLQNLYRFYRLFVQHQQFVNPFEQNLILSDCTSLSPLLSDDESLMQMAEFAFRHKHYAKVLLFYGKLSQDSATTADIYQKTGFCHQSLGHYEAAREAYHKALLLEQENAWTWRHLAQCALLTERFDEALSAWRHLAQLHPDDLQVEYRIGESLIHLGRYEEAFPYLYKVDYFKPDQPRTLRALAWCSLMTKKLEQAERFYQKLLSGRPTSEDYFNAGHAAWVAGNVPAAVERYEACVKAQGLDTVPAGFFKSDTAVLAEYGLNDDDMHIMVDALNQHGQKEAKP